MTESIDPLVGQVLADRYGVIRLLGDGGMGRVYLAEHVRMGRLSAVKVMNPAMAAIPDAIGRFNREAASAGRINHPNVAAIYDFGETADGTLYLAMEYVEGETLTALLDREGTLSPARVAGIVAQVAEGLHAAHHLGLVHRDLKPDNIMVTRHADGREWIKVVDFGIAKAAEGAGQTLTTVGMSVGTPASMSPEQIAGEQLGPRSDVYSLGVVAFTMLTSAMPHPEMTSRESLVRRLTARALTLAEVRPDIVWPTALQPALDRALAPEPQDRFGSAREFAVALQAAAGAPSVSSAPTRPMTPVIATPTVPAAGAVRRSPKAAVLAATGLSAALLAGGIMWAAWHEAPVTPSSASNGSAPAVSRVTPSSPIAPAPASHKPAAPPAAPTKTRSVARQPARVDTLHPRTGSHHWLRANGDTIPVAARAAPVDPAVLDGQEVTGHAMRASQFVKNRQFNLAWLELRTSIDEYGSFLLEHPGAPQTGQLKQTIGTALDDAEAACVSAREGGGAGVQGTRNCTHPNLRRMLGL